MDLQLIQGIIYLQLWYQTLVLVGYSATEA